MSRLVRSFTPALIVLLVLVPSILAAQEFPAPQNRARQDAAQVREKALRLIMSEGLLITPETINAFEFAARINPENPPVGVARRILSNATGARSAAERLTPAPMAANTPRIDDVSPSTGSTAGGQTVSLYGFNFQAGATVTFGGSAATSVTVSYCTYMTVTTPAHVAGAVDIVVTNPDASTVTLAGGFTYVVPGGAGAGIIVKTISPMSGPTSGGTPFTITGSGFGGSTYVYFYGASSSLLATSVTVVNPSTITGVTPVGAPGVVGVYVSSSGASKYTDAMFTYTGALGAPPIWGGISAGTAAVGTLLNITGSNFIGVTGVRFTGYGGNTVSASFTAVSSTQVNATVPGGVSTGPIEVSTVSGSTSSCSNFTPLSPGPPTVTSMSGAPTLGAYSIGQNYLSITGTNFIDVQLVYFNDSLTNFYVYGTTAIYVYIYPDATTGPITILTPNGNVATAPVAVAPTTYCYGSAPTVSSLSVSTGAPLSFVTLTGTNFELSSKTRAFFNGGHDIYNGYATTATQFNATVDPGAVTGPIKIVTDYGEAGSPTYTVVNNLPTITSVTTTSANEGAQVTFAGTNLNEAFRVFIGSTQADIYSQSALGTSMTILMPRSATIGQITVLTRAGNTGSAASVTRSCLGPTATGFSPSAAKIGSYVNITGTNFGGNYYEGTMAVFFGNLRSSYASGSGTSVTTQVPKTAVDGTTATVRTAYGSATTPVGLTVLQPAGFDFDANGRSDILWRNFSTGDVYEQQLYGPAIVGSGFVYTEPSSNWRILTTADFDGDGKADILWRNFATGQVYVQLINSMSILSGGLVWTEPDLNWKLLFAADFNGDGKADLLWRNMVSGQVYIVLMNGLYPEAGGVVYTEPSMDWQIVAVGDLNGDDKADLVWRQTSTGVIYGQFYDGLSVIGGGSFWMEANPAWQIITTGDFNGDGRADILWRNSTSGECFMLLMNGLTVIGGGVYYVEPSPNWKIMGAGDVDNDGKADVIWRNTSTGQVFLQRMNGTMILSGTMIYTEPSSNWKIISPTGLFAGQDGNISH